MNYSQSQEILEELKKAKRILLNFHRGPDPDSVGSGLAMYEVLKKFGKDVEIVCPDSLPEEVVFLPSSNVCKKVYYGKFDFSKFDLFIVMDSSSWKMVTGKEDAPFPVINLIVIDHHKTNTRFGKINLVDSEASSNAEVLYQVFKDWKVKIDRNIATNLLTGIFGDTLLLKYATPLALKVAAKLVEEGAARDQIIFHLFSSVRFDEVKMWGEFLARMELDKAHRFAWSAVPYEVCKKYENTDAKSSAAGLFGQIIRDTDFSIIMLEKEKNSLSLSFRSRGGFDVSPLAVALGGGGHKAAAGGDVRGLPFEKAVEKVLELARKYAKKN